MIADSFFEQARKTKLAPFINYFKEKSVSVWDLKANSDIPSWQEAFEKLPSLKPSSIDLSAPAIRVGECCDATDEERATLKKRLMAFHPWRKGPFELFGLTIDTEWRSDLKWDRFEKEMASLENRLVLDLGCGSGYHLWRMLGAGARFVVGVEPALVYMMQFQALNHYIQSDCVGILPFGVQHLPEGMDIFDTVFSMGLLYHRRDALEHLLKLHSFLREGGELVLETLVIESGKDEVLKPKERYAQMRNVWHIPSSLTLETWLVKAGFKRIRCVHMSRTSTDEQRSTDWMTFHSLKDFLNPENPDRTLEGYPAPRRAVFLAQK